MSRFQIADEKTIADAWHERWGDFLVTNGRVYRPSDVEGLVMYGDDGSRLALVTYAVYGEEAEVVSLEAFEPRHGYGQGVLGEMERRLRERGVRRAWLVTTNDNVGAIRLYLLLGWRLVKVSLNALEETRRLKPEVPQTGMHGLPLRDEFEFEKWLV